MGYGDLPTNCCVRVHAWVRVRAGRGAPQLPADYAVQGHAPVSRVKHGQHAMLVRVGFRIVAGACCS